VRRYQLHLASIAVGVLTINQSVSTLRFFFKTKLRRNHIVEHTHFIQQSRGMPVTLSAEEVARLLDAAPVLSYKAGTGLRDNDRSPATRAFSQQRPVHRACPATSTAFRSCITAPQVLARTMVGTFFAISMNTFDPRAAAPHRTAVSK
jgi:hypothetical protein